MYKTFENNARLFSYPQSYFFLSQNIQINHFFVSFQVKIWFQNRRAKWKRVKAGLGTGPHQGNKGAQQKSKLVVPIPVHVNRFAVRSQHQQLERALGDLAGRVLASHAALRAGLDLHGFHPHPHHQSPPHQSPQFILYIF